MADIYEQHKTAFSKVSAYAVLDKDGEYVASIAFKYPKDGAGRLYVYVHFYGFPMVRGFANGYGYDKQSAAIESACAALQKLAEKKLKEVKASADCQRGAYEKTVSEQALAFSNLINDSTNTASWDSRLMNAGFRVLSVVS